MHPSKSNDGEEDLEALASEVEGHMLSNRLGGKSGKEAQCG